MKRNIPAVTREELRYNNTDAASANLKIVIIVQTTYSTLQLISLDAKKSSATIFKKENHDSEFTKNKNNAKQNKKRKEKKRKSPLEG